MSQYLVMAQNESCSIERRTDRLAGHLAAGARAWQLGKHEGVPVIGKEVTLGEAHLVSRTMSHQLVVDGEVIGSGNATESPEVTDEA